MQRQRHPRLSGGQRRQIRTPFPNNAIPQSVLYLDPVAQAVQKLIPLPTGPNANAGALGNNFQNPFHANRTSTLPSFKLDHNLTRNAHLSFFYSFDKTNAQYTPGNGAYEGFPSTITAARGTFHNSDQERLNYDQTLSPTRVAARRHRFPAVRLQGLLADAGLQRPANPRLDRRHAEPAVPELRSGSFGESRRS